MRRRIVRGECRPAAYALPSPRSFISCSIRWRSEPIGAEIIVVPMVSSFALKEPHNLMATPPQPTSGKYGAASPQAPLPRSGFVLFPSLAVEDQLHPGERGAAFRTPTCVEERPLCRRLKSVRCSTGGYDRIFKSHIVEQSLDCSALRIRAAKPDIPIAMGMGCSVAHDDFAKRPPPCLRRSASLPDQASDKKVFEIGGRHTHRLAVVGD